MVSSERRTTDASASPRSRLRRAVARALLAVGAGLTCLGARSADPNLAHPTQLVTVAREGYTISGMATHLEGATGLRYGIALFAGSPGVLRLREENGQVRSAMNGNFLIRSRRHWLDAETLVLSVDAPSDKWSDFPHAFRESDRYGRDVAALLHEAGRRFGIDDWTLVGTSEGVVSAFHAARMNPALARRLILTASLFLPNRNGRGLSGVDVSGLRTPLLWVHHVDDPCRVTPYAEALAHARRSRSPLVTVSGGGPAQGPDCQARTAHGFVGVERRTVEAMRTWVKTGTAPEHVAP